MDLLEGIYTRRSIRQFTEDSVDREHLLEIIKAGTWAPSGLNNQPWRFAVLRDRETLGRLAGLTRYSKVIEAAPACIAVFIDREAMYHDVKDHQAMGACLQNMLLAAHALGLGAVWLGEILKSAAEVRSLLELPERYELMAVVALGHPARRGHTSQRKDLSEVLLKET
ncbi:MAG: nitroreductase family protein [Nitrospirota bacterium]|jgi:nitroreductase